jgi:hypothetical protein
MPTQVKGRVEPRRGWAFVSYAREDKERVLPIVEYLTSRRIEVWWDDHLAPGDQWAFVLQEKLNDASCVVVAWTPASVRSQFVAAEVQRAALDHGWNRGRLVPLLLDSHAAPEIPVPFNSFQYLDLTEWDGHAIRPLSRLGSVVGALVKRPPNTEERWGADLSGNSQVRDAIMASSQMRGLSERVGSVGQVLVDGTGPAADLRAALDEIEKTLDVVAAAVEEFVGAGLAPDQLDPRPYVRFERGALSRRIRDGRGHCDLIAVHYYRPDGIRAWLRTNAPTRVRRQADDAFRRLSEADSDLFQWLGRIGEALTNESRVVVNLLTAGQAEAARRRVLHARKILAPLEADLERSTGVLQEIEQRLGFARKA